MKAGTVTGCGRPAASGAAVQPHETFIYLYYGPDTQLGQPGATASPARRWACCTRIGGGCPQQKALGAAAGRCAAASAATEVELTQAAGGGALLVKGGGAGAPPPANLEAPRAARACQLALRAAAARAAAPSVGGTQ